MRIAKWLQYPVERLPCLLVEIVNLLCEQFESAQ